MNRKYEYLVAFHHSKGIGSIVLTLNKEIDSGETFNAVQEEFSSWVEDDVKNAGIFSYQLIRAYNKDDENGENSDTQDENEADGIKDAVVE